MSHVAVFAFPACFAALIALLVTAGCAAAAGSPTHEYRLANGM